MNELEETISRTLGHAAERAPRQPGALAARVEGRYRRRRARTRAVLAVAAAAVVATAGVVLADGEGRDPAAPASAVAETRQGIALSALARRPEIVRMAWPKAVTEIPGKLGDGREFFPVSFIDDTTLLVETWKSGERARRDSSFPPDALYAYDLRSARTRKIVELPEQSSGFTLSDGKIIWWAQSDGIGRFYSVPVSGGRPALIATHKLGRTIGDSDVAKLQVVGDKVVFSLRSGGVFSVPLSGGWVEQVPGSDGKQLLSWPWAGNTIEVLLTGTDIGTIMQSVGFDRIRNLETGREDLAILRSGETSAQCGVSSCMVRKADGGLVIRRRDGSAERRLPSSGSLLSPLARDRFYTDFLREGNVPTGAVLVDAQTGTVADLGVQPDEKGALFRPVIGEDERLLAYLLDDGSYRVIDLSKIK